MGQADALKKIRALIDQASETDDPQTLHKLLRKMRGIVNDALPVPPRVTLEKREALRKATSIRLIK